MREKRYVFLLLKSFYSLLFLLLFLGFIFVKVTYATTEFDFGSKEFQKIVSPLYMQGHADHDISTCSIKSTYYMEIAEMMQQGKTESQIIGYYVEQYGEAALKVPGTKGFSLTAWVVPFVVLLIATVAISFLIRSWVLKNKSRQLTLVDQEPSTPQPIQESTRLKIDEERKKYL